MPNVPAGFQQSWKEIRKSLVDVEGWLSDREAQFLATLGACPTCSGDIIELGNYHGRSTIALAMGAALADGATIHTVDFGSPVVLKQNLVRAGVQDRVRVFQMTSTEFLKNWRQPVRLFWHDAANDVPTVTDDIERLLPHLGDRGIIAFHDILNISGNRIFAFTESILNNPHFGAAGACGSIGWAQYHADPAHARAHEFAKRKLYYRLRRLYRFHGRTLSWPQRVQYKLFRSRVPHRRISAESLVRKVA